MRRVTYFLILFWLQIDSSSKPTQQVAAEVYRKMPGCVKNHIITFALNGSSPSAGQQAGYNEAIRQLFELPPCIQTHILYLAFQEGISKGPAKTPEKSSKNNLKQMNNSLGTCRPGFCPEGIDTSANSTRPPIEPIVVTSSPPKLNKTTSNPQAKSTACTQATCDESFDFTNVNISAIPKKSSMCSDNKDQPMKSICEPDSCDNRDADKLLIDKIMCGMLEDIDPQEVKKLVEKEKEDCDIFLSSNAPYIGLNPGAFSPKKKLQNLHANVPSTYPPLFSSADGAQYEPSPEMYVQVMQLIESKCDPNIAPNVNFNTLFNSAVVGNPVRLSPVAKGYFQDVVVPIKDPKGIQNELISKDVMSISKKLFKERKLNADAPKDDLYYVKNPKIEPKIENFSTQLSLSQEAPWKDIDLNGSVQALGAHPLSVVNATNPKDLQNDGALKPELQKGVDYYIETRAPPIISHVQIRGTEPPKNFPGYGFVLPYASVTQLAQSPSIVFKRAWQAVNPKHYNDRSIIRLHNKEFQ